MAQERYIHGKVDQAKHVGLYSNRKREQQADTHLLESIEELGLRVRLPLSNRTYGSNNQQTDQEQDFDVVR